MAQSYTNQKCPQCSTDVRVYADGRVSKHKGIGGEICSVKQWDLTPKTEAPAPAEPEKEKQAYLLTFSHPLVGYEGPRPTVEVINMLGEHVIAFLPKPSVGLIGSINMLGILNPILIEQTDDLCYRLLAGRRRLRCAIDLGLPEVPIKIMLTNGVAGSLITLDENTQRSQNLACELRALYAVYDHLVSEYGSPPGEKTLAYGIPASWHSETLFAHFVWDIVTGY